MSEGATSHQSQTGDVQDKSGCVGTKRLLIAASVALILSACSDKADAGAEELVCGSARTILTSLRSQSQTNSARIGSEIVAIKVMTAEIKVKKVKQAAIDLVSQFERGGDAGSAALRKSAEELVRVC